MFYQKTTETQGSSVFLTRHDTRKPTYALGTFFLVQCHPAQILIFSKKWHFQGAKNNEEIPKSLYWDLDNFLKITISGLIR